MVECESHPRLCLGSLLILIARANSDEMDKLEQDVPHPALPRGFCWLAFSFWASLTLFPMSSKVVAAPAKSRYPSPQPPHCTVTGAPIVCLTFCPAEPREPVAHPVSVFSPSDTSRTLFTPPKARRLESINIHGLPTISSPKIDPSPPFPLQNMR
jgi:hypothetical protein